MILAGHCTISQGLDKADLQLLLGRARDSEIASIAMTERPHEILFADIPWANQHPKRGSVEHVVAREAVLQVNGALHPRAVIVMTYQSRFSKSSIKRPPTTTPETPLTQQQLLLLRIPAQLLKHNSPTTPSTTPIHNGEDQGQG